MLNEWTRCTALLENLDQSLLQLDELSQSLRHRQARIEDNPERLAWVNDRLSTSINAAQVSGKPHYTTD